MASGWKALVERLNVSQFLGEYPRLVYAKSAFYDIESVWLVYTVVVCTRYPF
jgi:hypothetical protein